MYRERPFIARLRVIVGEVINHLLHAHRVFGRQRSFVDEAPHIRIRRRVHINRERGERIIFRIEKRVLDDVIVRRGIELPARRADFTRSIHAGNRVGGRLRERVIQRANFVRRLFRHRGRRRRLASDPASALQFQRRHLGPPARYRSRY